MTTLSIPLNQELVAFVESQVKSGKAENKAAVVRKALRLLAEEEAVQAILKAAREPTLKGNFRELIKKV